MFQMFIENQWVNSCNGDVIDVINPANGKKITTIPKASKVRFNLV